MTDTSLRDELEIFIGALRWDAGFYLEVKRRGEKTHPDSLSHVIAKLTKAADVIEQFMKERDRSLKSNALEGVTAQMKERDRGRDPHIETVMDKLAREAQPPAPTPSPDEPMTGEEAKGWDELNKSQDKRFAEAMKPTPELALPLTEESIHSIQIKTYPCNTFPDSAFTIKRDDYNNLLQQSRAALALKKSLDNCKECNARIADASFRHKERITALEEALRFYGDEKNWEPCGSLALPQIILNDKGDKARGVLDG